jgi:hypothetical protein
VFFDWLQRLTKTRKQQKKRKTNRELSSQIKGSSNITLKKEEIRWWSVMAKEASFDEVLSLTVKSTH